MVQKHRGPITQIYPAGRLDATGSYAIGSVYTTLGTQAQVATWLQARVNVIDYSIVYSGTAGSFAGYARTL